MAFCPEHPKWDQNPKFTPLSETMSIPSLSYAESSPLRGQQCTVYFCMELYRGFSHDVKAAILVFQNNETAAMLVYQDNPVGIELFSYVKTFFCSNESSCHSPKFRKSGLWVPPPRQTAVYASDLEGVLWAMRK